MLILRSFQKRPISKIDRFMVTLFDLGLTLAVPLGHSTTGLIVTGDAGLFNDITFGCVYGRGEGGYLNRSVWWYCRSPISQSPLKQMT